MMEKVKKKRRDVIMQSSRLFYYQGYVNTGINQILEECDIPKGTFYHYFKNKDDLLKQVIELHGNNLVKLFDKTVDDLSMVKLRTFFHKYFNSIMDNDCYGGSLLGNLAIEMSDINDEIRQKILEAYNVLEIKIMLFLQIIHNTNERYKHIEAESYAKMLTNQMEGTMLRMKLSKNKEEVDIFFKMFDYVMYKEL